MKTVLIVAALLSSLLAAVATADGGTQVFNVGGINRGGEASTSSSTSRVIDRALTNGGGSTNADPTRLRDPLPTGIGSPKIPATNGAFQREGKPGGDPATHGTFPVGPSTVDRPTSPSCSSLNVRIGEDAQSTVRCSSSVGGTVR